MDLPLVYARLRHALGGDGWWRAESPWEVMVGALLTQQTTWESVDRALSSLRAEGMLTPEALAESPLALIEACVRPTGFYHTKARRLRGMAIEVLRQASSVETFLALPLETLRRRLLDMAGVGEETADAILLYAAGHPRPVVDAYTRRILARLGLPLPTGYGEAARVLRTQLPDRADDHRRFHALMVRLGRAYCRRTPRCRPCPLLDVCPHGRGVVGGTQAGL